MAFATVTTGHVILHFGEAKLVGDIDPDDVNEFILALKKKRLKGKTVWHVIVNLRSVLNWAVGKGFLRDNPVNGADLKLIGSAKSVKPALDPKVVERAATFIENKLDRAWYDVTRFTGMRKDECNRLQWSDINWKTAEIRHKDRRKRELVTVGRSGA